MDPMPQRGWRSGGKKKIHHRVTEDTEKGVIARCGRGIALPSVGSVVVLF
jgi:hypothetical protein